MGTQAIRLLWAEPRPADAPVRVPRDWLVVAAFIAWSVVEAVFRQDLAPWPLLLVATIAVIAPLLWRRTHPLIAVVVAFGTMTIVDALRILTEAPGLMLNSISALLILAYALFRWGSGREVVGGLCVIVLWLVTTNIADPTSLSDTVTAYAFFLFAAALGAAIRFYAKIRVRDIEQAKIREREQLARELHDTVAHHVSGIAIQAQAGRAVAASHPDSAVQVFETIEIAATRTLSELRAIVGVLRDAPDAQFEPQPGIAEIEQLAADGQPGPTVQVQISGDFDDISPAVSAAAYRLAQESVTNARRHARHATLVTVEISADAESVTVNVEDNGSSAGANRGSAGYGLVGMQERASMLGGTFRAGPKGQQGWRVEATLPRTRGTR